MAKTYKVAYKVHLYERLQKVNFQGELTFPIYIQVTFDRKSIIFKSYYFELYSKPRFRKILHDKIYGPQLKEVIKKENSLIDFVIDKNIEHFSLDLFKKEYDFYCRDVLDLMEEGFIDYLHTYFNDAGLPAFAETVKEGGRLGLINDLIGDMKTVLKPNIYNELIENSFHYAPPYLPLNDFIQLRKKWPLRDFSVMEWQDVNLKNSFSLHMRKYFKDADISKLEKEVGTLISIG
ncbi:MAG: hypothetical protein WDM90_24425 [Ferruginibacter sp.]